MLKLGNIGDPLLELSLDELCEDFTYDLHRGHFTPEREVLGGGHDWAILAKDKEKFLDELATKFRAYVGGGIDE